MDVRDEISRYYATEGGLKSIRDLTETVTTLLCRARVQLPVLARIIQETSARQKASQQVLDESVS